MKNLFYNLPKNIAECFKGWNLFWQGIMIALTYIIVKTDFDWFYFHKFGQPKLSAYIFPAIFLGTLLPIFLPLLLLALRKINTAWAVGQAALLGYLLSTTYKAFTGRMHPPTSFLVDTSHGFRFGFLEGGIFWGWPSSHTTIAFSMALCLVTLYPKNKLIQILAIIYAVYVGLSVSVSIHWFSEFVAGAIMGTIIGIIVGKSFLKKA